MSSRIGVAGPVSVVAGAIRRDRDYNPYIQAYVGVSIKEGSPLTPSEARGLAALLREAADSAESLEIAAQEKAEKALKEAEEKR